MPNNTNPATYPFPAGAGRESHRWYWKILTTGSVGQGFFPIHPTMINNTSGLPAVERARRYIAALPPAVSGGRGHDATYYAACVAWNGFALDEPTSYALLLAAFNPRCLPPWLPEDLLHKVQDAAKANHLKPRGHLLGEPVEMPTVKMPVPTSKWPEPDAEKIVSITESGPTALELWQRSPFLLDRDDGSNCEEIVQALFADDHLSDPLLCIGKSSAEFATRPLSVWLASGKLPDLALIVPSPMLTRTGKTKGGKESEHTLESTGPRRFLVIEFDSGSADDHAARLWYLKGIAPLAAVVHSGGRSLHGWFYCQGIGDDELIQFMYRAVTIGADKATWTRSQFVRLPAGQRDGGCRQSVFYFDPLVLTDTGTEAING